MTYTKGIFTKGLSLILCVVFLISCHSNNNVVSSLGKRKYRKGWFWNRHGKVDTKAAKGKDTTMTHKYPAYNKPEKKEPVITPPPEKTEEPVLTKRQIRQAKRDSLRMLAKTNAVANTQKDKVDKNKPKEPPDRTIMRLLVLILVLTAVAALVTGLITPIVAWKITQNFLISVGVVLTFFFLIVSVDQKLYINSSPKGKDVPYNLGKPSWTLALWGAVPMVLLYAVVKTSLLASLILVEITTVGLFLSGAIVLLSVLFALKALFVHDIHKGKAVLALILDALIIAAGIALFI